MWRTRRIRRRVRPPLVWWRHRQLSANDSAIVSYPRSGSTWFASMIAELLTGADPDFHDAHQAVPEVADSRHTPVLPGRPGRTVRSHEPWRSEYGRTVYLARDPRDVAVSYYHYRKWLREYSGPVSEFVRLFVAGEVDTYGRWDKHVLSWATKDPAEVLVIQFERLVADTPGCVSDAAAFLGIPAEPEAIEAAVAHHGAASMRVKERAAHSAFRTQTDPRRSFVRSARSGDWRTALAGYDVRLIEQAFGGAMARLGYQLSTDGDYGHAGVSQLVGRIPGHQQPS